MYSGAKWYVLAAVAAALTTVATLYNARTHVQHIPSGCRMFDHPCDLQLGPYHGHPMLFLGVGLALTIGLVLLGVRASR